MNYNMLEEPEIYHSKCLNIGIIVPKSCNIPPPNHELFLVELSTLREVAHSHHSIDVN